MTLNHSFIPEKGRKNNVLTFSMGKKVGRKSREREEWLEAEENENKRVKECVCVCVRERER